MLENSSQIFAVIGSVALVISLALAIRSSVLDKIFQGLNTSLKYHHWAGIVGVVLVVTHGAIEAYSLGISFEDLKNQLQDPWILSGWISSLIFLIAIFQSRKVAWPHKKWRRVHLLMLPAWGLATVHAIYFSENRWIAAFFTLLGGIAIIRSQVLPRLPFWGTKYQVASLRPLNQRSIELIISPKGLKGKFPTEVAQYFYLRFRTNNLSLAWISDKHFLNFCIHNNCFKYSNSSFVSTSTAMYTANSVEKIITKFGYMSEHLLYFSRSFHFA